MKHVRTGMSRWGIARGLGVVAAVGLAAVGAPAGATTGQPSAFGESLEVRVVNLEAVVTDRQGGRVRGLQPGDFRLLVDGEEVPIDFFTEVTGGIAGAAPRGAAAIPAAAAGQAVETSYLVFVDDYFSIAQDRNRVLAGLRDQLGHLGPQDRMAIVAWDGFHLDMLSSWTGSQPTLARALDEAASRPATGLVREVEMNSFLRDRGLVLASGSQRVNVGGFRELGLSEVHYAQVVEDQVGRAVGAATSTLRAFAAPAGRKVLVLLSGGWPHDPADWATGARGRTLPDSRFSDSGELFEPLVQTANLLGYTIYTVDVPGMSGEIGSEADRAVPVSLSGLDLREQELHYSLSLISEPTGGRALLNGNRMQALEEIAVDTRSFYWLGFTADRQFDERVHDVRIELTRPGLKLRHRDGYQDFSREREVTMAVESALLFGSPSTAQSFPLQIGAARRVGLGKVEIPLELQIPVDAVTFTRSEVGWTASLDLRVAVMDDSGATAPITVVPFALTVAERPEPGTHLAYATTLRLRRDHHELLVAIHDPLAGSLLATGLELDPQ
jgi:VWFA-related protein